MKPTASFKMHKPYKTMIALMKGTKDQRDGWKRAMIDAQLTAEHAKLQSKKRSKDDSRD
jgi:hypothetical protein